MKLRKRTEVVIDVADWDKLVQETYGRPYAFQQQDGCRSRGSFRLSIPSKEVDDYERDTVPEEVNHEERGVSFAAWLVRDPKQMLSAPGDQDSWCCALWWERNFYPDVQVVANDLHTKGLLDAGDYTIDIDW